MRISDWSSDVCSSDLPKGIGALWLRDGVDLPPLLHDGGQEGGIRSGTLAPALCAGFGAAARLAMQRVEVDAEHVEALWMREIGRASCREGVCKYVSISVVAVE